MTSCDFPCGVRISTPDFLAARSGKQRRSSGIDPSEVSSIALIELYGRFDQTGAIFRRRGHRPFRAGLADEPRHSLEVRVRFFHREEVSHRRPERGASILVLPGRSTGRSCRSNSHCCDSSHRRRTRRLLPLPRLRSPNRGAVTGITRDWAAGATCYRTARTTAYGRPAIGCEGRTPPQSDRRRHEPSDAADASGMHAAATEAAPVKSAATTTEATTSSATTSIGIIRDQACGEQNDDRNSSDDIAKHDSNLPGKLSKYGRLRHSLRRRLT